VAEDAPPEGYKCPKCGGSHFEQDEDVLDTWFSSALWPFSTLGWPEETDALKTFYPTTVMETGFDIIFFWVARMMMMGLHFMGDVPFKTVYLHAMVRDEKGDKMSKVKGNVIDPLDVIQEYGADALRFTLATMTAQGRDIKMSVQRIAGYRAFMNKLWNAARFIFMNLGDDNYDLDLKSLLNQELTTTDKWILNRLRLALQDTNQALEEFRFNDAANRMYQFAWHEFCDWYIELSKGALRQGGDAAERTRTVLLTVLAYTLKGLHPFIPFITEELWQKLREHVRGLTDSVMTAKYPDGSGLPDFDQEDREMDAVIAVITLIRNIKVLLKPFATNQCRFSHCSTKK
jgi:valyl-tRNA synthetase